MSEFDKRVGHLRRILLGFTENSDKHYAEFKYHMGTLIVRLDVTRRWRNEVIIDIHDGGTTFHIHKKNLPGHTRWEKFAHLSDLIYYEPVTDGLDDILTRIP